MVLNVCLLIKTANSPIKFYYGNQQVPLIFADLNRRYLGTTGIRIQTSYLQWVLGPDNLALPDFFAPTRHQHPSSWFGVGLQKHLGAMTCHLCQISR